MVRLRDKKTWVPLGLFALSVYFLFSGLSNYWAGSERAVQLGLQTLNPSGLVSFRVVYGGMLCGIGVAFLYSTLLERMRLFGLVLAQSVVGSFLLFRCMALVAAEDMIDAQLRLVAAEVVEVVAITALIWIERRTNESGPPTTSRHMRNNAR